MLKISLRALSSPRAPKVARPSNSASGPNQQRHVRIVARQVVNRRISILLQSKRLRRFRNYAAGDRYTHPALSRRNLDGMVRPRKFLLMRPSQAPFCCTEPFSPPTGVTHEKSRLDAEPESPREHPSIPRQGCTDDVRGLVRPNEQDGICNLFLHSHAPGRNVCLEGICFVFFRLRKAVKYSCFRRTRANDIDTNACAGEFDGRRLRDAFHSVLAANIHCCGRAADLAVRRFSSDGVRYILSKHLATASKTCPRPTLWRLSLPPPRTVLGKEDELKSVAADSPGSVASPRDVGA
jgi:hypothetical protein